MTTPATTKSTAPVPPPKNPVAATSGFVSTAGMSPQQVQAAHAAARAAGHQVKGTARGYTVVYNRGDTQRRRTQEIQRQLATGERAFSPTHNAALLTQKGRNTPAYREYLDNLYRRDQERRRDGRGGTDAETFVSFYDELRRFVDLDKLEAAKAADTDEERGEQGASDEKLLGPEGPQTFAVRRAGAAGAQPGKALTPGQLGLIALAAMLVLGG